MATRQNPSPHVSHENDGEEQQHVEHQSEQRNEGQHGGQHSGQHGGQQETEGV